MAALTIRSASMWRRLHRAQQLHPCAAGPRQQQLSDVPGGLASCIGACCSGHGCSDVHDSACRLFDKMSDISTGAVPGVDPHLHLGPRIQPSVFRAGIHLPRRCAFAWPRVCASCPVWVYTLPRHAFHTIAALHWWTGLAPPPCCTGELERHSDRDPGAATVRPTEDDQASLIVRHWDAFPLFCSQL